MTQAVGQIHVHSTNADIPVGTQFIVLRSTQGIEGPTPNFDFTLPSDLVAFLHASNTNNPLNYFVTVEASDEEEEGAIAAIAE